MATLGFLLAADDGGEWQILEQGNPTALRQKFKELAVSEDHSLTQLFYTSQRGDVKMKRWKKRMQPVDTSTETETVEEAEVYTGEEDEQEQPQRPRRRRARKTKGN